MERIARLEEKHEASIKALSIQASEYERRLAELNHAHAKHEAFAGTFVTEEVYMLGQQAIQTKFDDINTWVSEQKGSTKGQTSFRYVMAQIITITIAAAAVGIALTKT
jgi:hypothetical protein